MLLLDLFSLLFCIVYCSENRLKINITPYGEIFLLVKLVNSQQSTARKNSFDGKIEYIMASMLIVLLVVW